MIGASSGATLWRRGDHRVFGNPRPNIWSGFMMAGTAPGVLLRVLCMWVRGMASCVAGAVGLVDDVTKGDVPTL